MTRKTQPWQRWTKLPLAVAIAAGVSSPAFAISYPLGNAGQVQFNTTLSAGAAWRTEEADKRLLAPHDGRGTASTNNYDNGNRNFDKGDVVSKIVKGNSELFLDYSVDNDYLTRIGGLLRGRYWYDFELKDEERRYRPLSSDGKDNASGGEILDAYIFSDWYFGNVPVSIRYGKQVLSWGESTFIQGGINTINPVDVPAFRAPGSELKDALLPVEMLYVSAGVTENVTVEAFVQTEWEPVRADDCGTFFSTIDFVSDGCGPIWPDGNISEEQSEIFDKYNTLGLPGGRYAIAREADDRPDSKDQFGVALRWYVPELNDSELGFYFIQYHSRLPYVSGIVNDGKGPSKGGFPEYFMEYPENIKLYGVSINTTTPGGWSLGAEYSFREDVPVQWNAFELIYAGLQLPLPDGRPASMLQRQREKELGISDPSGIVASGNDRFNVSQFQFTLIKFFDQVMGASRLSLINEAAATWVHDLPGYDEARYGRSGTFGIGPVPTASGDACSQPIAGSPAAPLNLNSDYCENDGFTTDFSWGYRTRLVWEYPNAIAGINLKPQLAWTHDVEGYSPQPGGAFNEGSKSLGLSVTGVYQNKITGNIGYTNYFGGKPYNELTDRDFVSASVSYSF